MTEKIEGTIVLQGLIEGSTEHPAEDEKKLRDWVTLCAKVGIIFNLEIEHGRFSLLPEENAINSVRMAPIPQDQICELLCELQRAVKRSDSKLYSTLRSTEYQPGLEIQTVYPFSPEGKLIIEQRSIEAETAPAQKALTLKQKFLYLGISLTAFAALLAVTGIFVDFTALLHEAKSVFSPLRAAEIQIDTGAYSPYIVVKEKEVLRGRHQVVLLLERTEDFPLDEIIFTELLKQNREDYKKRMAIEALVRGYLRCEIFDKEDSYLGGIEIRIKVLRQNSNHLVVIPFPERTRPALIRFVL